MCAVNEYLLWSSMVCFSFEVLPVFYKFSMRLDLLTNSGTYGECSNMFDLIDLQSMHSYTIICLVWNWIIFFAFMFFYNGCWCRGRKHKVISWQSLCYFSKQICKRHIYKMAVNAVFRWDLKLCTVHKHWMFQYFIWSSTAWSSKNVIPFFLVFMRIKLYIWNMTIESVRLESSQFSHTCRLSAFHLHIQHFRQDVIQSDINNQSDIIVST